MSLAAAQNAPRSSECLAMSQAPPRAAGLLRTAAAKAEEVTITSTSWCHFDPTTIDTPGGVRVATYPGEGPRPPAGGRLPDVVTMNRAHSTHYTLFLDARIPHVLHGWGDIDGKPAQAYERIGDVLVRNVTTDIRRYLNDDSSSGRRSRTALHFSSSRPPASTPGYLGHLHHKLDDKPLLAASWAGSISWMVPIDGTYTMAAGRRLRDQCGACGRPSRCRTTLCVTPLDEFHAQDRPAIVIDERTERSFAISRETLPPTPTVNILRGI